MQVTIEPIDERQLARGQEPGEGKFDLAGAELTLGGRGHPGEWHLVTVVRGQASNEASEGGNVDDK